MAALGGHFLQGSAWARLQLSLGREVHHGAGEGWRWLAVERRVGPFRYLYLPFGPCLGEPTLLAPALASARQLACRRGCSLVRFEPGSLAAAQVAVAGARRVRPRQYEHTNRLRLDVDDRTLWRGVSGGHRNSINAAERRGLTVESSNDPGDLADFLHLLRATERRAGFFSHEDWYFEAVARELLPQRDATLYFSRHERRRVATALVFDFVGTRYYAFGAAADGVRQLSPAAPLVWRSLLDARAAGAATYDFWGIAPPDQPEHPWSGISRFKCAFGGETVGYVGTWEIATRAVSAAAFAALNRGGALARTVARRTGRR